MDLVIGLIGWIVIIAVVVTIVRAVRSPPPAPRSQRRDHAGPPVGRPAPPRHDAAEAQRRAHEDAADAAFIEGVLFSHYFLDRESSRDDADAWDDDPDGDVQWDDDAFDDGFWDDGFHDDMGDW